MSFDFNNNFGSSDPSKPKSFSHFGALGDRHSSHQTIILKRSMLDGNVKIFEDSKGLAERTELTMPTGKVCVYKDYDESGVLAKYKKIDVLSNDGELMGSLSLYPRDRTIAHPVYRVFADRQEIGTAYGDIPLFLAKKLLDASIDPRSGVGTTVDDEVITEIKNLLTNKR